MIMGNNDGNGATLNGRLKNFSRMNDTGGQTADGDNFVMHDSKTATEIQTSQLFFLTITHTPQVLIGLLGIPNLYGAASGRGSVKTPAQLKTGNNLTGLLQRDTSGFS